MQILVAEVCCNEYDVVINAAAEAGETEERVSYPHAVTNQL